MKAQRRQALKQNELAETLKEIREFLQKYGAHVAGGVIVVAVILFGSFWWKTSAETAQRSEWTEYYDIQQSTAQFLFGQPGAETKTLSFDQLLEQQKALLASVENDVVRLRVLESIGDSCWMFASDPVGTPEPALLERALSESASAFERITREFPDNARAVGSALLSLAVLAEERGDFDQAQKHYEQIKSDERFADTAVQALAEQALEGLDALREPIVFATAPPPPPLATIPAPAVSSTEGSDAEESGNPAEEAPGESPTPAEPVGQAPQPDAPAPDSQVPDETEGTDDLDPTSPEPEAASPS